MQAQEPTKTVMILSLLLVVFDKGALRFRKAMVNYAVGTESFFLEELSVFSVVTGVFAGLMSASVRMRRKRAWRLRSVKDVVS